MEPYDNNSRCINESDAVAHVSSHALLSRDLLMARLGVYDLQAAKEWRVLQLILRGEELAGVDGGCAQELIALEILSLSHNKLRSLQHFEHFVNLIEITDITPLRQFHKLTTLSLYGNHISDLDGALHICRSAAKLRSLDLGGNPCSRESEGYKFQVVRVLPRLKTLDGDQITQLDKELAEEFVVHGGKRKSKNASSTTRDFRPFTAPAGGDSFRNARRGGESPPSSFDPFLSKGMPKGNVRLFRDDFLNNHPILLEYLVEDAQENGSPLDEISGVVSQTRRKFREIDDEDESESYVRGDGAASGFVGKMRTANPLRSADGTFSSSSDVPGARVEENGRLASDVSLVRPTTASSSRVQMSHFSIDPSDPKTTICKLLKHIEILMETISSHKNRQLDACSEALLEENARLQIENNNIPILQEQIDELKKQLAAASAGNNRNNSLPEAKSMKDLEVLGKCYGEIYVESPLKPCECVVWQNENAALKRENARMKQLLSSAQESVDTSSMAGLVTPRDDDDPVENPRRLASSEVWCMKQLSILWMLEGFNNASILHVFIWL
ncbi:hypothetical protein FI667_g7891, partial [Globisporangium splendens]